MPLSSPAASSLEEATQESLQWLFLARISAVTYPVEISKGQRCTLPSDWSNGDVEKVVTLHRTGSSREPRYRWSSSLSEIRLYGSNLLQQHLSLTTRTGKYHSETLSRIVVSAECRSKYDNC
jgi:hypothetical protein